MTKTYTKEEEQLIQEGLQELHKATEKKIDYTYEECEKEGHVKKIHDIEKLEKKVKQ